MGKFHLAFGVYGIVTQANRLLVIRKNGGPYINRYDLPGGSLEEGEMLADAFFREMKEETGIEPLAFTQLGTINFLYPWSYQSTTMNNHVCVFYSVERWQGEVAATVEQFQGQDSLGAEFVPLSHITTENASPLVLKAKETLMSKKFTITDQRFEQWHLRDGWV